MTHAEFIVFVVVFFGPGLAWVIYQFYDVLRGIRGELLILNHLKYKRRRDKTDD